MKKLLGLLAMAPMAVAACGGSGAVEGDINVYTRDTTSGTREGFFAAIDASDAKRDNAYLIQGVSETSGNGDMISKITNDVNGIGYISLTSLGEAAGVKGLNFNGIAPTEENASLPEGNAGRYGMTRTFAYTTIADDTTNEGKIVAEWNRFLATKQGQLALESKGVIVPETTNLPDYSADSSVCGLAETDIQIGGSTSVEGAAEAVTTAFESACAAFNGVHAHTGSGDSEAVGDADADSVMHIGFSSSGQRDGWATGNVKGDLGLDAIVAVVNKDNDKITNLTTRQLQEVFVRAGATHDGEYVATNPTNTTFWKDLV